MSDSLVRLERFYPEREFGGYSRVDGTVPFYQRIQALVRPDMVLLDVGCGRGAVVDRLDSDPWEKCRVFKGVCKKVIGIDVSDAGFQNPLLDEFRKIEGDSWPIESASIDLLYADAVLEHLQDPDVFFAECSRVVKPGGYVCFRTPNKWAYYSIIAALVPNRLHTKVLNKVQPWRADYDVFPTYYRANTARSLKRLFKDHHFAGCAYLHMNEPSYLQFSQWAFALGVYMHRWLPQRLWGWIFAFGRRLE